MCEFISWLKVKRDGKDHIIYSDDKVLFSERTQEILKGSKDNDFMGHHGARLVFGLGPNEGEQGELKNFWETDRLPKEIQAKLHDFKSLRQNFGKMLETYAQQDDLQYIAENAPTNKKWKGLREFCKKLLKDWVVRKATLEPVTVNVRYDLTIGELVKANKLNGFVNSDVNEKNYPAKKGKAEKREAILLCLNSNASDAEVTRVMKQFQLTDGDPRELLSLGVDRPDLQRKFPIAARKQAWRDSGGSLCVPCLRGWNGERSLGLGYLGDAWDGDYRFLAFRKSSRR